MFDSDSRFKNFRRGLALLLLVIVIGCGGLIVIEDCSVWDALYMTVITISTVGFGETVPLSPQGRVFILFLIVAGLAVMAYTLGGVGQIIIEGQVQKYLGRHRMQREIDSLSGHYIICGHGRMGRILCNELRQESAPFVVIEGVETEAESLRESGVLVVAGDATEDEMLEKAGVTRARGLVAVVSRDEDNLYITLSAREMTQMHNPLLYILSRATDESAGKKIRRAGANRVISPYVIGGMRIVQALLRPTVYDFVEIVTQSSGLDLMFEELAIGTGSRLVNTAIMNSGIREDYDVIVIAVKKSSEQMVFNPGPEYVLETGDVMITLGDKEQLARLAKVLV